MPRRSIFYGLSCDGTPVPFDDPVQAARTITETNRRVDFTDIGKGVSVSTVFLWVDHNPSGEGPPILFETMAFDELNEIDHHTRRYATRDEAKAGHNGVVLEMKRLTRKRA